MTDSCTEARKALAEITAIEGVIAACDPPTMHAIAAPVDAQDAQIAALRESLQHANQMQRVTMDKQSDLEIQNDKLREAATAFEALIRADERSILASQILPILDRDRQAFFDGCTIGGDPKTMNTDEAEAIAEYDAAIRAMKGEGE